MNVFDNLPVDFQSKIIGTPVFTIKAADLMANFADAKLIVHDSWTEPVLINNHASRKLKIPAVPTTGTHILAAVNGTLTWLATEAC